MQRRIEPKEAALPNSTFGCLYAVYGLCAMSFHNSAKSEESIKQHIIFQAFALITGKYIANYMGSKQSLSHTNIKSVCYLSVGEKNIGYRGGFFPVLMASVVNFTCAILVLPPISPKQIKSNPCLEP